MAKRRARTVHYPDLSEFFTGLRERRGWKQSEAASFARRRGLDITYQALRGLEEGRTRHPDPGALKALASLYGVPYAEVVAEVVRHAYGLELRSEGRDVVVLTDEGAEEAETFTPVRVLADKIAAGPALVVDEARTSGLMAFSQRWLDRNGIRRPVCIQVGRREKSMLGTINPGEVVLLDCDERRRMEPKTDRIYAVNVDGGSTLKRLIIVQGGILLVSDNPDKDEYPTREIALGEDQWIQDVIVGEVMWKGQHV